MPYKDPIRRAQEKRNWWRKKQHGHWRQIYYDANGACCRCGSEMHLEFHEPFGENKQGAGKMQQRVLLCIVCHAEEHLDMFPVYRQRSMLSEDVATEIAKCGSVSAWAQKYGVKEA